VSTRPRILLACLGRERFLGEQHGSILFFHLVPGLAGAWTEIHAGVEHVLFGYPPDTEEPWFRALDAPAAGKHTAATLAIERIIFARAIEAIAIADSRLEPIMRHGASRHPQVKFLTAGNDGELLESIKAFVDRGVPA
jgi:hypothetical protein